VNISRSTVYYDPRSISAEDLWLMRRIEELHLNYPFAGSRMLRGLLWQQGLVVGRRHIKTLMRRMGVEAIYRKPNTSKPAPGHRIYPYLLRGLAVLRSNQVWAMDITYIPMARGFIYLAAVVDWFTRRVLAWKLSITMESSFCIEALEEALSKNEKPEIFNTDQGSQFTSEAFTGRLKEEGIRISMDGKAAGATTFLSSGCGSRSSTRRSICTPTNRSSKPESPSATTWSSIIPSDRIPAWMGLRPIRFTSTA
jgi:putative transposase